jgi:hypothetical protein
MKRTPLLLIGLACLLAAGCILFFGIKVATVPVVPSVCGGHSSYLEVLGIAVSMGLFMGLLLCFWIGALVHMLKNQAIQGTDKIVWALVIIFLHILGAIIYFLIAPRVRLTTTPQAENPVHP